MTLLMIEGFKCDACGHIWSSTVFDHTKPPHACASCKSPYWNRGANAMKGKEYKRCVYCDKKKATGPFPFMKPYAVCSSCITNVPNFSEDMGRWQNGEIPLGQILEEAHKEYEEYQKSQQR